MSRFIQYVGILMVRLQRVRLCRASVGNITLARIIVMVELKQLMLESDM